MIAVNVTLKVFVEESVVYRQVFIMKKLKIMLQKGFEERIGRSVTLEEYEGAMAMYMAAGDIDMDTFCREWKRVGESPLVIGLFDSAYNREKELNNCKLILEETEGILKSMGTKLKQCYKELFGCVDAMCELSEVVDALRDTLPPPDDTRDRD